MQNLLALATVVAANQDLPRNYSIKAEENEATVYVYDVIGGFWGGVDAEQFAKDIAALDVDTIHVRVNSPGGDVFDARAMMTALQAHKAKVIVHIDGLAASAATFLAMAGDEIEMASGGFFMIHDAWTLAMGNRHDMRETADLLERIDGTIAADYVNRTGLDAGQVNGWMDAETWFTAEEAKEHGFVDRVIEQSKKGGGKSAAWNVAAYRNAPKALTEMKDQDDDKEVLAARRAELERRLALIEKTSA